MEESRPSLCLGAKDTAFSPATCPQQGPPAEPGPLQPPPYTLKWAFVTRLLNLSFSEGVTLGALPEQPLPKATHHMAGEAGVGARSPLITPHCMPPPAALPQARGWGAGTLKQVLSARLPSTRPFLHSDRESQAQC